MAGFRAWKLAWIGASDTFPGVAQWPSSDCSFITVAGAAPASTDFPIIRPKTPDDTLSLGN